MKKERFLSFGNHNPPLMNIQQVASCQQVRISTTVKSAAIRSREAGATTTATSGSWELSRWGPLLSGTSHLLP